MKRRVFLAGAAAAGVAGTACRREASSWRTLSDAEARTLEALCGQIIPADDTPGAAEAGAVNFIDIQLTRRYKVHRAKYRDGLAKAESIADSRYRKPLASLAAAERLSVAEDLEKAAPEFFGLLVGHTMQSYYGSPRHGGNRDAASWRMLGLPPAQVRGRNQYELAKGGHA